MLLKGDTFGFVLFCFLVMCNSRMIYCHSGLKMGMLAAYTGIWGYLCPVSFRCPFTQSYKLYRPVQSSPRHGCVFVQEICPVLN